MDSQQVLVEGESIEVQLGGLTSGERSTVLWRLESFATEEAKSIDLRHRIGESNISRKGIWVLPTINKEVHVVWSYSKEEAVFRINRVTVTEKSRNTSIKELAELSPSARLFFVFRDKNIKWAGISSVIGVISLALSIPIFSERISTFIHKLIGFFFSSAEAQTATTLATQTQLSVKDFFLIGMMILLSMLFVWALFTLTFSKKTRAVSVATEAVKTLMGFFIGTLTGFSAKW